MEHLVAGFMIEKNFTHSQLEWWGDDVNRFIEKMSLRDDLKALIKANVDECWGRLEAVFQDVYATD